MEYNIMYFRRTKRYIKAAGSKILYFGRNSNLHGFRHVMKKNAHPFSRIFWIAVLLASAYCVYVFLQPVLQLQSAVSFTPDTLYLDWQTAFPAVSVCESTDTMDGMQKRLMALYPEIMEPLTATQRRQVSDIMYGGGYCNVPQDCPPCGEGGLPCDIPWRKFAETGRLTCEKFLTNCRFFDKEFPCCELFRPTDSVEGVCFTFNGILSPGEENNLIKLNRTTGPTELSFTINGPANLMIHTSEEPFTKYSTTPVTQLTRGFLYEALFSVVELEGDAGFRGESIEVRECRYPHELMQDEMHTYPVYSFAACKIARETEDAYNVCGCVHPIRDLSYQDKYCNITGIYCLNILTRKLQNMGYDPEGVCLTSCIEMELQFVDSSLKKKYPLQEPNEAIIRMAYLPSLRYKVSLLRTNLDLVVTIGGLAGLFFGASILSFVEIYYLFLRLP